MARFDWEWRGSPTDVLLRRLFAASIAVVGLCSLVLLRALPDDRGFEPADALDTHPQRMLFDMDDFVGQARYAKDWARRQFVGNISDSRHASAYLSYHAPPGGEGKIRTWYHTLVPKHSADDTYFSVQGTQFGYMGLQQVRDYPFFEGKVVFSMWDKGSEGQLKGAAAERAEDEAEVVECGYRSICTRFGGEGTGAKSYINFYKWGLEETYGFLTKAVDAGKGRVRYEGYFHAEELGGWVLVSKIEVRRGSLPWQISRMYSFTEQWSPRDFGEARWAKLGPSFVQYHGHDDSGSWSQVRDATFTHTGAGTEDTSDVNANVTNNDTQWGLGMGGHVDEGHMKHLRVDAEEGLPAPLQEWRKLVEKGEIPTGCKGHTCTKRWWIALFREAFSSSHLPTTLLGLAAAGLIVCYVAYVVSMLLSCCSPQSEDKEPFLEEAGSEAGHTDPSHSPGSQETHESRDGAHDW